MIYLEAPNYLHNAQRKIPDWRKTVFLGGSITGAWNWQNMAKEILLPHMNVFNPRRENFDVSGKGVEREQIMWERSYLDLAENLLFYFSYETLAPITLFELGASLENAKLVHYKKIYIAIHPDYKRKNDIIIQTELINNKFSKNITFNLNETLEQIIRENT